MRIAQKYGALNKVALKPCSAPIELGLVSIWTACVRGRQGKGSPGRNAALEARFLTHPENPAQPTNRYCTAFSKGSHVTDNGVLTICDSLCLNPNSPIESIRSPKMDLING